MGNIKLDSLTTEIRRVIFELNEARPNFTQPMNSEMVLRAFPLRRILKGKTRFLSNFRRSICRLDEMGEIKIIKDDGKVIYFNIKNLRMHPEDLENRKQIESLTYCPDNILNIFDITSRQFKGWITNHIIEDKLKYNYSEVLEIGVCKQLSRGSIALFLLARILKNMKKDNLFERTIENDFKGIILYSPKTGKVNMLGFDDLKGIKKDVDTLMLNIGEIRFQIALFIKRNCNEE